MQKIYQSNPVFEMFVSETLHSIEKLEQIIISSDESTFNDELALDEIFRIVHTLKGTSSMIMLANVTSLSHAIEDLFFYLRENKMTQVNVTKIINFVLEYTDIFKYELKKLEDRFNNNKYSTALIDKIKKYLTQLEMENNIKSKITTITKLECKNTDKILKNHENNKKNPEENFYQANILFYEDSKMENIRAYNIISSIKNNIILISYSPKNLLNNTQASKKIKDKGFSICFKSHLSQKDLTKFFTNKPFVKSFYIKKIPQKSIKNNPIKTKEKLDISPKLNFEMTNLCNTKNIEIFEQNNKSKLDLLLDSTQELICTNYLISQNLNNNNFININYDLSSNYNKHLISSIKNALIDLKATPLIEVFQRLNCIVYYMSNKLNKNVKLVLKDNDTIIDGSISHYISESLIHMTRNCIDHGIETIDERVLLGKNELCQITLEAKYENDNILIILSDDGKGLDKNKIQKVAISKKLISNCKKNLTDDEIYSIIFLPGFSTKENVTEFSGRGVGIDVVKKNIQKIGGTISVLSTPGQGTTFTIKIPLVNKIIDGTKIKVGNNVLVIPSNLIKEQIKASDVDKSNFKKNRNHILYNNNQYRIINLKKHFNTNIKEQKNNTSYIFLNENKHICIIADCILGNEKIIIKKFPNYLNKPDIISGYTLLENDLLGYVLDINKIK